MSEEFTEIGRVRSADLNRADELMRQAVEALRALSYADYLRTEHWLDFREGVLKERPACEACGEPSTQVHHMSYDYLGRERLSDVKAFCAECHRKWHEQFTAISLSPDDIVWAGRTRRFGRL